MVPEPEQTGLGRSEANLQAHANGKGPLTIAAVIVAAATILYFAHVARAVLIPFAIAVFLWAIAASFDRLLGRLYLFRHLPGSARTAFLTLIAFGIFLFIAVVLASGAQSLVTAIPRIEERLQTLLSPVIDQLGVDGLDISVATLLTPEWRLNAVLSLMTYTRTFVTLMGQVVIFLVFFSMEGRYFPRRIAAAAERIHKRERVAEWADRVRNLISRYLAIKVLASSLVGAASYVLLRLSDSEFAAVVGSITFLLNFIPILGSIIAVVIGSAVSVLTLQSAAALLAVVALLSLSQIIVGNFVENALLGYQLNLSPTVMLLTLTLFGLSWGVVGMVLCVPILVTLLITTAQFESTRGFAVLLSMTGDTSGVKL
jgi:predicted PurR-regulated permease PerM